MWKQTLPVAHLHVNCVLTIFSSEREPHVASHSSECVHRGQCTLLTLTTRDRSGQLTRLRLVDAPAPSGEQHEGERAKKTGITAPRSRTRPGVLSQLHPSRRSEDRLPGDGTRAVATGMMQSRGKLRPSCRSARHGTARLPRASNGYGCPVRRRSRLGTPAVSRPQRLEIKRYLSGTCNLRGLARKVYKMLKYISKKDSKLRKIGNVY